MNVNRQSSRSIFFMLSSAIPVLVLTVALSPAALAQMELRMKDGKVLQGKYVAQTPSTLTISVYSKSRDAYTHVDVDKSDVASVYDLVTDADVSSNYLSGAAQPGLQQGLRDAVQGVTTPPLASQSPYSTSGFLDVVYLQNGSVIRGIIIEQVPNVSIKIQTKDGSVFHHSMAEVQRLAKEPVPVVHRPYISEKSPGIAFLLSFLITGGGQFYNGETAKGIFQLGGSIAGWAVFFSYADRRSTQQVASIGLLLAAGCSIWSMIDAPISASAINDELRSRDYQYGWDGRWRSLLQSPHLAGPGVSFDWTISY